jgi:hypothetical protein
MPCGCFDLDRKHETRFAQLRRCFVRLACGYGRAFRRPYDYFCYVSQDEVSLATERQARGQGAGGDSGLWDWSACLMYQLPVQSSLPPLEVVLN